MQWLCCQLFYVTAANQWTIIVEIELLAIVGWKCGCQPFSCRCSQNVTHCRKEICSTCLFKESIPATPFGNFNRPLPARSRFLIVGIELLAIVGWKWGWQPFSCRCSQNGTRCRKEICSTCLFKESIPVTPFVNFSHPLPARSRFLIVGIELLAYVVWKRGCRGCQPFSCRCSQSVTHCRKCRKEICSTCLFKESIPAIPFGNSKHPLPTRSLRFLSAAARSNSSALWLHHAHPFVAVAWKTCLIEISRGFGHGVVVWKICYNAVIVLSVLLCDCCKPMINCWDWAFSNSVLEVWLPAFQLAMFPKCDTRPEGDLFEMFV